MPKQLVNIIVLSLVAIGVAGLMLSTIAAIGAEGVGFAERKKLAATLDNREAKTGAVGSLLAVGILTLLAVIVAFLIPARRS